MIGAKRALSKRLDVGRGGLLEVVDYVRTGNLETESARALAASYSLRMALSDPPPFT